MMKDTSQLMEDLRAIHTKISQMGSVSLNHLLTRLIPISDTGVSIMQVYCPTYIRKQARCLHTYRLAICVNCVRRDSLLQDEIILKHQ